MDNVLPAALLATTGTWLITALGAATVLFFRRIRQETLNLMLGFAAGVMIAASFWSLLQPAVELTERHLPIPAFLTVTGGFSGGVLFMWGADRVITAIRRRTESAEGGSPSNRILLLVLSITLHNIPEGLAVGVAFGALAGSGYSPEALMGAVTIAAGIGLQNFPEGAAVSLPLRREGCSRSRSFWIGQASGLVEPLAGVAGAAAAVYMRRLLPFALSFAAGTMILVAVHELIPECQQDKKAHPYRATMGVMGGFLLMTLLDLALG